MTKRRRKIVFFKVAHSDIPRRETGRAESQSLRDPVTPEVRRHASGSLWQKHPGSPLEPGLLGLKRYSQGLKGSSQRRHVGEKPVSRLRMRCVTWVRLERAACAPIGGKAIILRGLAGRRSKVGWISRVGRISIGRMAGLARGRWWNIHVDALAIDARGGRGLRSYDAAADDQRSAKVRDMVFIGTFFEISSDEERSATIEVPGTGPAP